jgi:hypothetical protein
VTEDEFITDALAFLRGRIGEWDGHIDGDTELVESGILDSLLILEFFFYLEQLRGSALEPFETSVRRGDLDDAEGVRVGGQPTRPVRGEAMTDTAQLREAGWRQARLCDKNGSPTYVALIDALVARLGSTCPVAGLLAGDQAEPVRSAMYLRLLGAVHRCALADPASPLRAYYPTLGGRVDPTGVVGPFFAYATENLARVAAEMRAPVQTNEVGRGAPLSAAMNYVASVTALPLRLLEVGCSAGLNLWLDRFFVTADGASWGPPESPLRLTGHFAAGAPPVHRYVVAERRGCDPSPLDIRDPRVPHLLRSFIWPEHVERLCRLDAALAVAPQAPPATIDTADACSWAGRMTRTLPVGAATVVYHSMVLPYLSPAEHERFGGLIRDHGRAAGRKRPLVWVSLEPTDDDDNVMELTCEVWPDGERTLLARSTPHGTRIRWNPEPVT